MAKDKISDYSSTANSNTDIAGINIDEGCAPSGINDAIRTLMAQLKNFQTGTGGDSFNGPFAGTTIAATDTTDASSTTAAAMKTAGGLAVAKKAYIGLDANIYGLTVGRGAGAVSTNTAVGASALAANTSGTSNSALGLNSLGANTTGTDNTSVGRSAMTSNTAGTSNTAIGSSALGLNTTADNNTAVGYQAAYSNQTGTSIVAVGSLALYNNTASQNVGVGTAALYANTSGTANTAIGPAATYANMRFNTTGSYNTSIGAGALALNTTASYNTAVGYQAGYSTTTNGYNAYFGASAGKNFTGLYNTIIGAVAGSVTSSSNNSNTLVGYAAGYNSSGTSNTFVGAANSLGTGCGESMTTGSKNTILGAYSGNQGGLDIRTANNNIVISDGDGNPRLYFVGADVAWKSAAIYNFTSANSANMYIGSGYDIGRITSALKYKQDIRDLEEINIDLFRPVRYKSKCANDDQTKDYFGFIADEVADAGIEELVVRNAEGEVESFAYDRMTVVLLKEVQRLKAEVNALKGQA